MNDILLNITAFLYLFNTLLHLHMVNKEMWDRWNNINYLKKCIGTMKMNAIKAYNITKHTMYPVTITHGNAYGSLKMKDFYSLIYQELPSYDNIWNSSNIYAHESTKTYESIFGTLNKYIVANMLKMIRRRLLKETGWVLGPSKYKSTNFISFGLSKTSVLYIC